MLLNEEWDLENLYSWNNISCRGLAIQLLLVWPLIAQQIIHRAMKHCVSKYFPYSGQNIQRHTRWIYVEICLIIINIRVLTSLSYPELTVVKDNSKWNGDRLYFMHVAIWCSSTGSWSPTRTLKQRTDICLIQ